MLRPVRHRQLQFRSVVDSIHIQFNAGVAVDQVRVERADLGVVCPVATRVLPSRDGVPDSEVPSAVKLHSVGDSFENPIELVFQFIKPACAASGVEELLIQSADSQAILAHVLKFIRIEFLYQGGQ